MRGLTIKFALKISLAVLALVSAPLAYAKDYKVETLVSGLDMPWGLAFLPNGEMLVTELSGKLRVVSNGALLGASVSGVPTSFYAGQGGLMDVVLHPEFADNQLVYLSLATGNSKGNATRVIRGRLNGRALEDVQTVFEAAPAKDTAAHYGARMAFLPDNTLLVTVGDGFNYREEAQNRGNHFGTIVRVSDSGKVPADNPFVADETTQPEIWTYGHRNPQGIVVDPATGLVFASEHGARGGDELNLIEPGKNYGWPVITLGVDYSGAKISPYTSYPGMEQPLYHWTPSIAPAGMTLYRGDLFPDWRGDIFLTSLVYAHVERVDMDGLKVRGTEVLFDEIDARIRDIRTGPDGALYILSEANDETGGKIWRVTPAR